MSNGAGGHVGPGGGALRSRAPQQQHPYGLATQRPALNTPSLPPRPLNFPLLQQRWYHDAWLTPADLHQGVLQRCQQGKAEVGALYALMTAAEGPADAALALDALRAVRLAAALRGRTAPLPPRFAVRLLEMVQATGAYGVLASAMRAPNELGLAFNRKSLHALMARLGAAGRLAELEELVQAMPCAGVAPNHATAYILIRAHLGVGRPERARYWSRAFAAAGVRMKPTAQRLLDAAGAGSDNGGGDDSGEGVAVQ